MAELFEIGLLDDDEDHTEYCRRGVEHRVQCSRSEQRHEQKEAVVWAVLEEQELQRIEGSCDPEFLAEICANLTKLARSNARANGLDDQFAAGI